MGAHASFVLLLFLTYVDVIVVAPPGVRTSCPSTAWMAHGSHCYYIPPSATPQSWYEAQTHCMQLHHHATLASIHSDEEVDFIAKHTPKSFNVSALWIGLYRTASEGWSWYDQTTVDYQIWPTTDGNESGDRENCAHMTMTDQVSWQSDHCENSLQYICKVPQVPNEYHLEADDDACPNKDWHQYGNHCFLFRLNHVISWQDAEIFCNSNDNGRLATILDESHSLWISTHMESTIHSAYWIGLHRQTQESPYVWSDGGSRPELSMWEVGEPSLSERDELCVKMDSITGHWADTRCNNTLGYVCSVSTHPSDTLSHLHPAVDVLNGIDTNGSDLGGLGVKQVFGGILAVAVVVVSLSLILILIVKRVAIASKPYRDESYKFVVS